MAVVIRMKRTGRRNRPCYRISVADSRFPRDGRVLETIGLYDPIAGDKDRQVTLNVERAQHWISEGATPSETVTSIFKRQGVFTGEFALAGKHKPRKRPGRKKTTATGTRRAAAKAARGERKTARRDGRIAAKKAEAAAAAAAESGDE
jgi:small subunit ribosomal protein S16